VMKMMQMQRCLASFPAWSSKIKRQSHAQRQRQFEAGSHDRRGCVQNMQQKSKILLLKNGFMCFSLVIVTIFITACFSLIIATVSITAPALPAKLGVALATHCKLDAWVTLLHNQRAAQHTVACRQHRRVQHQNMFYGSILW